MDSFGKLTLRQQYALFLGIEVLNSTANSFRSGSIHSFERQDKLTVTSLPLLPTLYFLPMLKGNEAPDTPSCRWVFICSLATLVE